MLRRLLAFAFLTSALALRAQDASDAPDGSEAPPLYGQVEGRTYISPTGAFKVAIPVLPELGGTITDTANVVTFHDAFSTYVSIAVFPQDKTQQWEQSTRGTKDYLAYFFANNVLAQYKQAFQGVDAENAVYSPKTLDGALFAYLLIPGGSMFMDRVLVLTQDKVPVAKRGNMVFVKNGYIFVISTELSERVTEGSTFKKTAAQEDQILRDRLDDIVNKIQFLKSPDAKATAAPK